MNKLWFASTNKGKIKEIKEFLFNIDIKTISDFDEKLDIPEDYDTFVENAKFKAKSFFDLVKEPVLADDSGLSIESLNGFPGVHSARWAKPITNWTIICEKILNILDEKGFNNNNQRKAFFTTVLVYYDGVNYEVFEGKINGRISKQLKGENGFGYSPIFVPRNSQLTHAQMSDNEKIQFSHRHIALEKFKNWYFERKKYGKKKII